MRTPAIAIMLLLLMPMLAFSVDITNCQALSSAGTTYDMTSNAPTNTSTCFTVTANNVVLDCHGYLIDGDDGIADMGVTATGRSGLVVRNCIIQDFGFCISLDGSSSSNIYNNTCTSGTNHQIRMRNNADNNVLNNNTVTKSSGNRAVTISDSGPDNNIINNTNIYNNTGTEAAIAYSGSGNGNNATNNNIYNNSYGIGIDAATGSGHYITGNTIQDAPVGLSATSGDNYFLNNAIIATSGVYINQTNAVLNQYNGTFLGYNATYGVNATFNISDKNAMIIGTNIYIQPTWAAIDSAPMNWSFSHATLLFHTDATCENVTVGYSPLFFDSYLDIKGLGSNAGTASCSGGLAQYNVTDFSSYAIGDYFGGIWILPFNEGDLAGMDNISIIMNVTFYDESNLTQINATSAVLVFSINENPGFWDARNMSVAYSGNLMNATIKAYPNNTYAVLDSVEMYSATGYTPRSRFFVKSNTSLNTQQNVSVYMLQLTSAEYALINVVDNGEPVDGAIVNVLKFFSSDSTYTLTDSKITNNQGQAATYVEAISYYKFTIYDADGGSLYTSSGPEQFICQSGVCSITINVGNLVPISISGPYANATCYGVNATNSIVFSYVDPTGKTSSVNFRAYRENVSSPVCNYSVSGATAGYVCALNGSENLSNFLYSCEVWRTASPPYLEFINLLDLRYFAGVGDWLLAALTLGVVLMTAAASLPLSVALGGVSLFILSILGVMNIDVATSGAIMVVGFVLAFFLSKRGAD